MNCPACENTMKQMELGGVVVDVCEDGCGGVWFDNFEMKKFDEKHETAGEALLDIKTNPSVKIDHSKRIKCPQCDDIVMMRHFYSVKHEVVVDKCPGCNGYWLDCGELRKIRGMFETEQQKEQAAHEFFDDMFGAQLKEMKEQNQADLEKSKKMARMFRFICPTNYIPGKQDWGAF